MSTDHVQSQIEQIAALPGKLDAALQGLSSAQLDLPCGQGEWTVRQVVHHLADAHLNGFVRMKLVLTENKPILKPYEQDRWIELHDMDAPLESSLAILGGLHQRWHRLMARLPGQSWSREGIHLESGLVNLRDLLDLYVDHGRQHLDQIRRLKKSLAL